VGEEAVDEGLPQGRVAGEGGPLAAHERARQSHLVPVAQSHQHTMHHLCPPPQQSPQINRQIKSMRLTGGGGGKNGERSKDLTGRQ
jgi:hypothetical protein